MVDYVYDKHGVGLLRHQNARRTTFKLQLQDFWGLRPRPSRRAAPAPLLRHGSQTPNFVPAFWQFLDPLTSLSYCDKVQTLQVAVNHSL